jgi:hypothetical protein
LLVFVSNLKVGKRPTNVLIIGAGGYVEPLITQDQAPIAMAELPMEEKMGSLHVMLRGRQLLMDDVEPNSWPKEAKSLDMDHIADIAPEMPCPPDQEANQDINEHEHVGDECRLNVGAIVAAGVMKGNNSNEAKFQRKQKKMEVEFYSKKLHCLESPSHMGRDLKLKSLKRKNMSNTI